MPTKRKTKVVTRKVWLALGFGGFDAKGNPKKVIAEDWSGSPYLYQTRKHVAFGDTPIRATLTYEIPADD